MNVTTIERGRTYRLADFRKASGLGRDAFRHAVAAGLAVKKVGRRKYVTGDDWHDFLDARPAVPTFKRPRP